MTLPRGYHISLEIGGVEYPFMLPNPEQYYFSDLSDYTKRSSNTGTLGRLNEIATFEQRSFHGGMGQIEMKEASLYRYGEGLDSRTPGVTTLWTQGTAVTANSPILTGSLSMTTGAIGGTNYLLFAGTGGVTAWSGSAFSDLSAGLPNTNVREVYHNGTYLFAGMTGAGVYRFTGSVAVPAWTEAGTDADDFACFTTFDRYYWAAQQTARSNLVHYQGLDTFAGFEGNILDTVDATHPLASGTGDPNAVQVGPIGYAVKRLVAYDGQLYAFRLDGIWVIHIDENLSSETAGRWIATKIFDYSNQVFSHNFDAVAVWNGALWWGAANKVYRYTGGTLVRNEPQAWTFDWPPDPHRPPRAFQPLGDLMYAIFDNSLYVTDGTGWHHIKDELLTSETGAALRVFPGAPTYDRLGALLTDGSASTLHHWRCDDEYARTPYESTGYLITSRYDDGNLDVNKSWRSLRVLGHIPTTGGSISATAYSFDNDSVTTYTLGTISTSNGPASITLDGEALWNRVLATMEFPAEALGKQIEFKFTLTGDDSNAGSPVFYGYNLSFVPRPVTVYGYRPVLILADNMRTIDGRPDPYRAYEKLALLIEARESATPLRYEDFLGNVAQVFVSATQFKPVGINPSAAGAHGEWYEIQVNMSLVEVERGECVTITISEDTEVSDTYTITCETVVEDGATLTVTA